MSPPAASVRLVQARDGMGQPDDAFHRQHKADAVAGLVEVHGRVDGVQDAVGPLLGDEDHDDVLFGLNGDVEDLLLLMDPRAARSEEHTSELQSRENLVCRLLLEKKKQNK